MHTGTEKIMFKWKVKSEKAKKNILNCHDLLIVVICKQKKGALALNKMIQDDKELIREVKRYFGKDRRLLKRTVKSLYSNEKDLDYWNKFFSKYCPGKYEVNGRIFKEIIDALYSKNFENINWNWLGDLSWDVEIILNNEVKSHLDFDKKLAGKCKNNTIRFLNIYISEILTVFSVCTFYKFYKDNIYEYGPIKLTKQESNLIYRIKNNFKKIGYYYVKKKTALKKFKVLRSDLNSDGNATLFDCLFNDLDNYTDDYFRGNDKIIIDLNGRKTLWKEYYNSRKILVKREDSRWFKSGDLESVLSDGSGNITQVNIYPVKKKPHSIEINIDKSLKKFKNKSYVYLP